VTAVIIVPDDLDHESFESVLDQLAACPPDAPVLVDARHTTFATPYALLSLLCLAQSRTARPGFVIPEREGTASYWARAGFFRIAEELYSLHGNPPALRPRGESDVWLPITPINRSEDVHAVVEKIQDRAEAILENELRTDPRMIGRFAMTLSEACQNILEHAGRGGWVAVQSYTWPKLGRRVVQIAVCDSGIGFTASLAPAHARRLGDRWCDGQALEEAIVRGVSRFADPGRGQGFAGIKRFLGQWGGKLIVRSGTARLTLVPQWDDDVPLREGLSSFPGAQVLIIIPGREA